MQFDMWVMPVSEFVHLSELRPHEELRQQGKLMRCDASMRGVFFLSHQWTSSSHPDHTTAQLRSFQTLLLRMVRGELPKTTYDASGIRAGGTSISAAYWQDLVPDAFVWIDFFSVPQKKLKGGEMSDQEKATNSIAAYIERSSHFFVICPTVHHQDLEGTVCDYGTWLQSSGCRMELFALLLARHNRIPAIVVKGGDATPFLISPTAAIPRSPGLGLFRCCERNHLKIDSNGKKHVLPCRRSQIAPVIHRMLQKRREYHLGLEDLISYRLWSAFSPHFLAGLPAADRNQKKIDVTSTFLREYRFDGPRSEENRNSGITPLMLAAASGHVGVVRELLQTHSVDVNAKMRINVPDFGLEKGQGALSFAVSTCPSSQVNPIVSELLLQGADPNKASAGPGTTPLMSAVISLNLQGVKSLVENAGDKLELNKGLKFNNATALSLAAFYSTTEIVEALIQAGANVVHIEDGGGNKLTDACSNPAANPRMLEVLSKTGLGNRTVIDVNDKIVARTLKWATLDSVLRKLVKGNYLRSHIAKGRANCQGSTPLHMAARQGNVNVVQWLLQNGAQKSLHVKNKMGCTALDVARIFGPHHEVEGILGAAMLEDLQQQESSQLKRKASRQVSMQRLMSSALRGARSGETAIRMQYPMYVVCGPQHAHGASRDFVACSCASPTGG